jgi:esterase
VLELSYESFGSPDHPPLIILHGFLASSRNWRSIAQNLSATFHVWVPDMRNHGNSPHHPLMDYPSMAQDLLDFIKQRQLSRVNLLGHSMGGKIAMWLALNYPEQVLSLIVADIAPIAYSHCFDDTFRALKALPLTDIQSRKQAEHMLASEIKDQSYRQFLLQNLILQDGQYQWRIDLAICAANSDAITGFPPTDGLPAYNGRALFIAGANSQYVNANAVKQLFPYAHLSVIANAGHWLHVQQPTAFLERVEKFLSES